MLRVTVQRASDLPDVDTFSKSDPYVKISYQGMFTVDLAHQNVQDFGFYLLILQSQGLFVHSRYF